MRFVSALFWRLNAIVSAPVVYFFTVMHWATSNKTWQEVNEPTVKALRDNWNKKTPLWCKRCGRLTFFMEHDIDEKTRMCGLCEVVNLMEKW